MAALAGCQHGVVAARQLIALGYSRNAIAYAKASGRLQQLHRGVYAVGHRPLTWQSRCLAATLSCGANAVGSHRAAAWIWGLIKRRPDSLDVTVPVRRRHARSDLRLHYAALAEADRDLRECIPVTAVPRTLLDLAAILGPERLDSAIERSEELRLFDLRAVDALLARAGGHPGAGRLRRALALYRQPPFTRSGLERRFLELVRSACLPSPATGYNVAGYELDVYWETERFAVELDAYETHGSRRAFERDRLRQEELKLHGVEMIRVTGHRLEREPDVVIQRVATLLSRSAVIG
ncbi:MAG: type IV toxin-antitoxin system AbiEi family antitoxin domain-containing protein [Solirubrobacterales bacterium]